MFIDRHLIGTLSLLDQAIHARKFGLREVERLATAIDSRKGAVDAALAKKETLETADPRFIPYVAGTVQQFALRPGDVVNAMLRPDGVLIADEQRPCRSR